MRTPNFALHATFSAAFLGLPALGLAQAIPSGYVESARLKAVATNQTFVAKVINNKGEVGGYTSKPNGSILRIGYNVTPLGFSIPYFYSAPQVDISPVVWTAGVPKVLPRYKSTYSTWLLDKKDDSTWLVATAATTGRLNASYFPDDSSDAALGRAPLGATPRLLQNGVFSDLPTGLWDYYRPRVNRKGTVAGHSVNSPAVIMVRNGQRSEVAMPTELAYWEVKGLSDNDEVLIEGATPVYSWKKHCYVWNGVALSEIQVNSAQPVISVACGGISSTGIVAGFAYQQIGAEINPYALLGSVFTWRNQILNQSEFVADGGGAVYNTFVTPAGLVGYNRVVNGRFEGAVYAQGRVQPLPPVISPALAAGETLEVLNMNDLGQLLVGVWPTGQTPKPRYAVLSPK
jgi:hypothetical protein